MSKLRVPEILEDGAATYRERNAIYGDNWETFRDIMGLIFPEGLDLRDPDKRMIYNWLEHLVGKITRFSASGFTHQDSIHDICVYAAMIEAYVQEGGKAGLAKKEFKSSEQLVFNYEREGRR
jgi:hypothetical protein